MKAGLQTCTFRFASGVSSPLAPPMGFFDRFSAKKSPPASPTTPAASTPAAPVSAPASSAPLQPASAEPVPDVPSTAAEIALSPQSIGSVLLSAREKLDQRDLPGALAIYERVLAVAGDRADVLVTISGDLGLTGHVESIAELIAPRYDADRHGPATGLNLLQAYLATRNTTAARHTLDILFALRQPELEQRLYGFSNALAELIEAEKQGRLPPPPPPGAASTAQGGTPPATSGPVAISLISISKPIWLYGLEPIAPQIVPPKGERLRRVAFAQLSLMGNPQAHQLMKQPEEEQGRLTRALPLWLAETFCFCPIYAPIAAVGMVGDARHYALFPAEWTVENLRQLVDTSGTGLDYIFTGALQQVDGDTEVLLRVWEVKKFRERKQFSARWTPATMDLELTKLHQQIRQFMEWSMFPAGKGMTYTPPASPKAWLDVLGASLTLFLGEKSLLAPEQLTTTAAAQNTAALQAASGESASLAWLTLSAKARALGVASPHAPAADPVRTALTDQATQIVSAA